MLISETMSVKAANGVRFVARILRDGDQFGTSAFMFWDHEEPGIEFYDARHPFTEFGQFISRYYVDTILGRNEFSSGVGGLDLQGGVESWKIDAGTMMLVRIWLDHEVPRA